MSASTLTGRFGYRAAPQPSSESRRLLDLRQFLLKFSFQVIIPIDHGKAGFFRLADEVFQFGKCQQHEQPPDRLTMKGFRTGCKLIFDRPLLPVGQERAVDLGQLPSQFIEARLHQIGGRIGVGVVDGQFEEFAGEKASFDCSRLGFREWPLARGDADDPQSRLVARQGDGDIKGVASCPGDQFFWRVPPAQAEGRLDERLGAQAAAGEEQESKPEGKCLEVGDHPANLAQTRRQRKAGSWRRGFALVDATIALSMLTVVGLLMLKLSLNILHPRQWVLHQSLADAYMTYERSYAERVPFSTLVGGASPWPTAPTLSTTEVEIGRLPGGAAVRGNVVRTRIPHTNNYPIDGGSGTVITNPTGMKVWQVQSILTYQIGGRTYAKSRTVIRSQ